MAQYTVTAPPRAEKQKVVATTTLPKVVDDPEPIDSKNKVTKKTKVGRGKK